jgi:hypothetical protein
LIDVNSETWEHIVSKIETEVAALDKQNRLANDENRTTQIRARIRAFEDVLTWADAGPENIPEGPNVQWLI